MFELNELDEILRGLNEVRDVLLEDSGLVPVESLDKYQYLVSITDAAMDWIDYSIQVLQTEINEEAIVLQAEIEELTDEAWVSRWKQLVSEV